MVYCIRNKWARGKKQVADVNTTIVQVVLLLFFSISLPGCLNYTQPTPLNQAAWDNDVGRLEVLIGEGVSIDEVGTNPNGTRLATALDTAVIRENIEATQFIIDAGADVNRIRFFYVNTANGVYEFKGGALMCACLMGNTEIARLLLENGARIDLYSLEDSRIPNNFSGVDAFGFSSEFGHVGIVNLLIEYGLNVNQEYRNRMSPVYNAYKKGHLDYIIALIDEGLVIGPDDTWAHYDSEIAHIAADHYSGCDERRALQMYRLAIQYYPAGIMNYQVIENSESLEKRFKKPGKAPIAVTQTMRKNSHKRLFEKTVSSSGMKIDISAQTMVWMNYYRKKAETSRSNYRTCNAIVNSYEDTAPKDSLADCVKASGRYSATE